MALYKLYYLLTYLLTSKVREEGQGKWREGEMERKGEWRGKVREERERGVSWICL